jgi:peptidoglycan-N-acetylglucosamine deacetylase
MAVIALIALLGGVAAGARGGRAVHHPGAGANGYFARIKALAGRGPGSFVAAERAAENRAINHTLRYTPYVRIAGSQHRELALTFDDGPGPYTPTILSILERHNVPATFFEVGVLETYFHASTAAIVARGYPVGDHTESHAPMGKLSKRDQRTQLIEQISATGAYGAPFPRLFRPPYGSWNSSTLRLLHKFKMLMVLWTVDTSDYRRPGVTAIVHSAVSGARPGAIILLHDAGGDRSQTVAALPKIIKALRARGYRFVTVPKLLLDNPAPHNQKISAIIGSGG